MRNMPWQWTDPLGHAMCLQKHDSNMIHYHKEGAHLKTGLNITFGRVGWKPWVSFVWCRYDVKTRTLANTRLRIRTHMKPMIIKQTAEIDVVSQSLMLNDLIACPRELLEDYAPKLIPLAGYFNQQYKAGVISRYNG